MILVQSSPDEHLEVYMTNLLRSCCQFPPQLVARTPTLSPVVVSPHHSPAGSRSPHSARTCSLFLSPCAMQAWR